MIDTAAIDGTEEARRRSERRRLGAALGVTLAFFLIEAAGGWWAGSLALLADAAHMFTDVAALTLAFAAMRLADRQPTDRYTFGFYRAEVLAAFVNAEILLVASFLIFREAFVRLDDPPVVGTGVMTVVAAAGLAANLVSLRLLHHRHDENLNLRAAYLEVLFDAVGSLGALLTALVMAPTGWYWLDPVVSVAIGLLVLPRTIALLRRSAHILLEGTPGNVDLGTLRDRLLAVPGVVELHDLHFWTLTPAFHSATVHVRATAESPHAQVLRDVQRCIREEAGVDHVTVQVEWGEDAACETSRDACDREPPPRRDADVHRH